MLRIRIGLLVLGTALGLSTALAWGSVPAYRNPVDVLSAIPADETVIVGRVVRVRNTDRFGDIKPLITFAVRRTLRGAARDTNTALGFNTFAQMPDGRWLTVGTGGAQWFFPDEAALVALREYRAAGADSSRSYWRIRTAYFLEGDSVGDGQPLYGYSGYRRLPVWEEPRTDDLETLLRAHRDHPSAQVSVTLGQARDLIACPVPPITRMAPPNDAPRFSFWGNRPDALPPREPDFDRRRPPQPVAAPDVRKGWGAEPGEPLFLVRGGRIVAAGRVGTIFRGWWARAGDDRLAYFTPAGLPDTVMTAAPGQDNFFPKKWTADYDLYVLGRRHLAVVSPDTLPLPDGFDLSAAVCGLVAGRIIDPGDFPDICPPDSLGRNVAPPPAAWVSYLRSTGRVSLLRATGSAGRRTTILRCAPVGDRVAGAFCAVLAADGARIAAIRGTLDTMLDIEGDLYLVMRDARSGTGAWGYSVYRVDEAGQVRLVFEDSSWST